MSLLSSYFPINDSQKIDSLLDEFTGELTLPHSIPPGIDDVNLDPEGDIFFLESLLYDNSSPRPPEEFNSENSTESFSPSPIPVEDSDSLMEEIDIFLDGDDSIPPGIESDDFDSEDDDNSTSRPEFESFHVDYPDSGDSTIDVVEDIPVDVPNILPTHLALQMDFDFIPSHNNLGSNLDDFSPSGDSNKIYDPGICIEVESTRFLATLSPVIDTLIPFSSKNDDKVFNHGVLASKEKSPSSSSHRGLKVSKLFHQKSPMLIHGDNTPNLGVRHPHLYPHDKAQVKRIENEAKRWQVRGGRHVSTRYCSNDGWTNQRVTRGTGVCQSENSMNSSDPTLSSRPTKVEVPKELPKVCMVNTSLNKLKHHLAGFDVVVKERTTATAITEGSWGFEHTKAYFKDEIIPFVKALKDLFNTFDQYLIDELSEVQNVFHQMEQAVEQHRLESKTFEAKMNQVLNENERLLEQVINKDIVNIIMNSSADNASVNVHECEKCLKLETELLKKKDFIEKETYDKLFRSFTTLKKHCISLEVDTQLNQEIFQKDNSVSNQSASSFDQYFELNELKAQSQEKVTVIKKLKERIKSLSGNMNEDNVKKDLEEIETVNIELDHREQGLIVTALKNELGKLKGKDLADNVVCKHTIDLEMLKIDEEAAILKEIVEHGKSQNPLNESLDSSCKYTKQIQELLIIVGQTCPNTTIQVTKLEFCDPKEQGQKRVTPSTSTSGSQPSGNTKKDKIQRTPSSTQKNKDRRPTLGPRKVWKPTRKVFSNIGYIWRPTGRTFTIVGNMFPLTRITTTTEVHLRKPTALENETPKHVVTLVYSRKPRKSKTNVSVSKSKVIQIVLWNVTISRVYYMEGLGHNLFSVGQFCDSNLKVAFRQHTCFIRNLEGDDLLTGSRGNNLYTLSLGDMMESSPIYLLSKASKTKSWLWHRRLSHLNFSAINHLARHDLVRGLPKFKFEKDQLCSACAMGKSKNKPHKPKSEDINQEKLYLLHMDLCGPMRVASINGKKSKDEAPDFIIKFLKMIQVRLQITVRRIRIDNGTEFVNQTLREYYEKIEAVATACYTQNRSIICLCHDKTPYEILHDKPPDLSFFHVFGALCYPTNNSENLDFDELTAMASEHNSFRPALREMTPATINPEVIAPIDEVVALVLVVSTGSPSSTTVDQDAPSPSNSQTTPETQPPIIPNDVEEDNHDIEVAHMGNDPYFGIPIPEIPSDQSSSSDSIHITLHEQALFCYYDAFLAVVKPKTYKDALTQSCWIEAMQKELNELERLKV
ncbi:retrovirus-related pol polyprotein from transposon TNT 1-94 [Tanacetum coccineum]